MKKDNGKEPSRRAEAPVGQGKEECSDAREKGLSGTSGHRRAPHLTRAQRTSQFLPFDALEGLGAEIRSMEKETAKPVTLSEESAESLDARLRALRPGDIVTVTYLLGGQLHELTGAVARVDTVNRVLQVVETKIPFSALYGLRGSER